MLKTKEEITQWLIEMNLSHCIIHQDLTVSSSRDIDLSYKNLTEIPIQFKVVRGKFICNNNKLTSLKGVPLKVEGYFSCEHNQIASLEGLPVCSGAIYLNNNNLTSLKGLPKIVNCALSVHHNLLTSLEYCSEKVNGIFSCNDNQLNSLKHAPRFIQSDFNCEGNLFNPLMENEIKNMMVGDLINFSLESDTNNDLSNYIVTGFNKEQYISMPFKDFKQYMLTYKLIKTLPNNKVKETTFKI